MTHVGHLTALTLVIALGGGTSSAVEAQQHGRDGQGMQQGMQGARHANMAERFETADTDGDGEVSRDEMVARMTERATGRIETRVDRMIAHHDTDGDGMLTLEEMRAGPAGRMFTRLDADGDGTISREEFSQMRELREEMRQGGTHGMEHGGGHGKERGMSHGARHGKRHGGDADPRGGQTGNVVIHHHHYYGDK